MCMNKSIVFLVLLLLSTAAVAQSLTGRVVDTNRAPLEVVSVVLFEKATRKPLAFTRTDADGQFTLSCPDKQSGTLIFTLLGYAKDSIDIQHFRSGQMVVLKEQSY